MPEAKPTPSPDSIDTTSPFTLVIFGASGDLTRRKLIPALHQLYKLGSLPQNFKILGVARTAFTDAAFRKEVTEQVEDLDAGFSEHLYYQVMDTDASESYQQLSKRLTELEQARSTEGNIVFYLALPPKVYASVAEGLAQVGLQQEDQGYRRLVVEKPFGYDLKSAQALNQQLLAIFSEKQIYRIDHYLGKETVQNVLIFRFANGVFEPVWNRQYIDYIEITAAESNGVGERGGYYENAGALRDMLQNHLMQVMGLIAMEPPANLSADALRNETLKVFQSLRPLDQAELSRQVVRGQYTAAKVKGEDQPGYREAEGVDVNSRTETFVALKAHIDNWRWAGTPFILRTGKALPTRVTEVAIHFKPTPHRLFRQTCSSFENNSLVLRIQPDAGVLMKVGMKVPGDGFEVQPVGLDFHYSDLTDQRMPEAYERLLLDCVQGDRTLYIRGDATETCWNYLQPVLDLWQEQDDQMPLYGYPAGSWGPEQADDLLPETANGWRNPCRNLNSDGDVCEL